MIRERTLLLAGPLAGLVLSALSGAPAVRAHEPTPVQIERLDRELEGDPDAPLFLRRAELHRIAGDLDAAVRDCASAAALDPGLLELHLCWARIALDRGEAAESASEAEAYLAAGGSAEGWRVLARARVRLGRPRAAADAWRRAAGVARPPDPGDFLEGAALLAGDGDPDGALALLEDGLHRLGRLPALEAAGVEIARDAGRTEEALRRIDRLCAELSRSESWTAERGRILLAAGRVPEAWAAFSRALDEIEALPATHRGDPAVVALETELRDRLRSVRGSP